MSEETKAPESVVPKVPEPVSTSVVTQADLDHRFGYHAPKDDATVKRHQTVRNATRDLADHYAEALPAGREKSLALTKLEEAMFWGNAAIARNAA